MRRIVIGLVALAAPAAALPGQSVPPAIYTDPAPDPKHPARMEVLHIPSGGVEINGVAYVPAGAGPHPVVLLCHGLPGNEKNLDLAQALRRAGWTVVTFNYRGSWGSPANAFGNDLADADAVPICAASVRRSTATPRGWWIDIAWGLGHADDGSAWGVDRRGGDIAGRSA